MQPPDEHRPRIERYFDPIPFWYAPFEGGMIDDRAYPMHAITQRPMAMYHSWGSQNAWLRQIHAANRLFMHRDKARALGIADDDWVWISSHIGRIKAQVKLGRAAVSYGRLTVRIDEGWAVSQPNALGGGARLKGIDADWLARRIVRACERRQAELIVPARVRILLAIAALSPRLGDWLVNRWTR